MHVIACGVHSVCTHFHVCPFLFTKGDNPHNMWGHPGGLKRKAPKREEPCGQYSSVTVLCLLLHTFPLILEVS